MIAQKKGEYEIRPYRHNMNWQIQKFATCSSTNTQLKEALLSGKVQAGTVFIADEQTQGHGRLDRTWVSPKGNVALSCGCPLPKNLQKVYQLNLIAALSVLHLLKNKYGFENVFLKWPNDVWIKDKKVCGILSEVVAEADAVVVGIGVNVNSRLKDFPQDLRPLLTTLKEIINTDLDLPEFIKGLLKNFDENLKLYLKNGLSFFLPEITKDLKYFHQRVRVESEGNAAFEGKILGIDENGFLKIKTDNEIRQVISGDVTLSE